MAFHFGQFNEFSDPVTQGSPTVMALARVIELGPYTGRFYQRMAAPEKTITQKTFKVYTRSKTSRHGAIGTAWDNAATANLSMDAQVLKGLTLGHVLEFGDGEAVIIKSVDRENNTITVRRRGDGDTPVAAKAEGAEFRVIGHASEDTELKFIESMSEETFDYENYVQTVFEAIDWTKHAELVREGMTSAQATVFLIREAEIRVAEMLSAMAIHGKKQRGTSGPNGKRYMSAGMLAQLRDSNGGTRNTHIYDAAGDLTAKKINDFLKRIFNGGGKPNTLWCSFTVKEFLDNLPAARTELVVASSGENHTAGGVYVTRYNYQGAILDIEVDSDMPEGAISALNMAKCKKGWLDKDGLRFTVEPSLSTREHRRALQGSVGFLLEDVGIEHGLMTGITGGPTERIYKTQTVA